MPATPIYTGKNALCSERIIFAPSQEMRDKLNSWANEARLSKAELVRRIIQKEIDKKKGKVV